MQTLYPTTTVLPVYNRLTYFANPFWRCVPTMVPTPADICRYLLETREHHLPGEYFHMVFTMTMADSTHSSF